MSPDRTASGSQDIPALALRVAILHYSAPPLVGGVERVIGRHASLMADDGHSVTLLAGRGESSDPRVRFVLVPLADSAHPRILRQRRDLDAGVVPADFEATVEELTATLRRELAEHEVLLAHNICSLHFDLALTAALHRLVEEGAFPPLVAWHHDLAWTQERHRRALHVGYPWDLLRTAWPGARHVAVSAVRREEVAALMGIPATSVRVIRNGIDLAAELGLSSDTDRWLERTAMLEADPLLLTPTRITPRKNIALGLEVVAEMRRRGRPAGLVVTGPVDPHEPAQREYLASLLGRRSALGLEGAAWFLAAESGETLSDRVVTDLYRLADALFLPSREEGFGLPVLEAALHRLPIICTDLPVLREIAGEGATYLDPDADPAEAAAATLARLDSDTEDRLWRSVRREYAWPAIFREQLRPLLLEVAGVSDGGPANVALHE